MEHKRFQSHRLGLILGIYLVLAVSYSIMVPIGRGADEWAHYWYAQFIAQHGRLPANPAEREAAGYKSDWPPLYHVFAAGLTAWVDTDGPPTFKYRLDNIRRQLVPAFGPEAIVHTEDEQFPWQQEILVWHLGRFLSIAFSLGTLLITYFLALDVFSEFHKNSSADTLSGPSQISHPKSQISNPHTLALVSVAILAFNPRFLFTGMLFNYDSLTLVVASLFLWLTIRVAKEYYPRWGFWALGALAGLALITKYLTALLPLIIILVALIVSRREPDQTEGVPLTVRFRRLLTRSFLMRLPQAGVAFLLITSWWFAYLLINFNEIETYGPILGSVAPLLRGDGSDRTVEALFALISGDQTVQPAFIEKQNYSAWQIIRELPMTFWGNPISEPYPLTWFVVVMTTLVLVAAIGLVKVWQNSGLESAPVSVTRVTRSIQLLLLLICALPLPFMIVRLFGARDALEAVQGRHILFLAGPAFAVLMVWGLAVIAGIIFRWMASRANRSPVDRARFQRQLLSLAFQGLLGLLLVAGINQIIWMSQLYPPLSPVRTTPYRPVSELPFNIRLDGGAELIDANLIDTGEALEIALVWRAGSEPPPEDYQVELAMVDSQGQTRSSWLAYQTQARYPTRTWEPGDTIYDLGWLPYPGLAAGDYKIRLRLWGEGGEIVPWQTLAGYSLKEQIDPPGREDRWLMWRNGHVPSRPPILHERETVQFTLGSLRSMPGKADGASLPELQLIGPNGLDYPAANSGPSWANVIIGPDWPPGEYRTVADPQVAFRVGPNSRNFVVPAELTYHLEANFQGQIKLWGYRLVNRRVQPGDGLPITLYWQGLRWMGEEFVIFNRLLDNQQVAWGGYDRLAKENYSTLLWAPGEVVIDGFAVPVASTTPDGIYILSLGWYQMDNGNAKSLLILDPETGEPTGATAVTIGPIKVGKSPPGVTVTEIDPEYRLNVTLGEQIRLLGFDQAETERQADPSANALPARFTLYWQTIASPDTDYTVFAHVRNASGEIVAQNDRQPVEGRYPTSLWDTGEIIKDEMSLSFDRLEPGAYELVVGLYDFTTGLRLPVEGSPDESILIQSFEVGQ